MISYFVRYDGQPADGDAFYRHYRDRHAPILQRFDGILGLTLHVPTPRADPLPVDAPNTFLLAQMTFADAEALARGLASTARVEARRDFERFPSYDGRVLHQAMRSETIF